ncbi:MAG: lysophospholipid acyltransferase family protein [Acidobacteria bacterium]|nr:lysophospholipid acyltransferase family protein [Acidobacteriota bacterium]
MEIKERGRPLGSPFSTWLHFRLVPFLGAYLLKLWMATLRVRVLGDEALREIVDRDERFILTFWHRRLVMMPLAYPFRRKHQGVAILASDSRDGERSTATWAYFRIHAVRGTASDDGAKALVRMIRAVKEGWDFGITPDGPRGPRQRLKPGVLALARKTGAWIVPVCVAADHAVTLKTWDRMVLPLPFSEVTVRYGAPTRHVAQDEEAVDGQALEAILNGMETWAEGIAS